MGIWIRSARAAAITGGGPSQDITISSIGTPKGCIVTVSSATADDTSTAHGSISYGISDGTRNKVVAIVLKDAVAASAANRYGQCKSDKAICVLNPNDGSVDGEATVTLITDGVRITWSDLPSAAYLVQVTMLGGDLECFAKHHDQNSNQWTQDVEQSLTGFGFEVDAAWFGGAGSADFDVGVDAEWFCAGFASLCGPAITQSCLSFVAGDDGGAPTTNTDLREHESSNRCLVSQTLAGLNHKLEVTGRDPDGLKITARDGDAVLGPFWVLGVKLPPGAQARCTTIQAPAGTGNTDFSGWGFKAIASFAASSLLANSDTDETGTNASGFGLGVATESEEFAQCFSWRDVVSATTAKSRTTQTALRVTTGLGSTGIAATRNLFDWNVLRLNFSLTISGRKTALMVIGQSSGIDAVERKESRGTDRGMDRGMW